MAKRRVTEGQVKREVGKNNLQHSSLRGGHRFPIRHAKVSRVDAKRMVVDLVALAGPAIEMKKIPLTFPNAGNRHFMGAIPEVGDICLVGMAPAESGRSKRFVILGWFVPSTDAGYDWLNVRSHSPEELGLAPKDQVVLEGAASQRRHKLRQIEKGNIIASSSQGADLLLTESATLANRRGNEVILRDQDQALVVRSLQQFHAGAGFRTYSGMIQRDANLLPTQLKISDRDWASDRQVDEQGNPLPPSALDRTTPSLVNKPELNDVFAGEFRVSAQADPLGTLGRGLFLDAAGNLIVGQSATYGGKPMYRVSTDLKTNGVDNTGIGVFTEYRIEVAHTTDGTLPVTEQTDGLDVDRLLKTAPPTMPDGQGGPANPQDPNNQSPNAPLIEFVLGTAVGNDAFNDPESYGVPLVAKIGNPDGSPGTTIRPYDPATDRLSDQLAFLIRSRDPEDPTKESFLALSKGGAWLTNFQGEGSAVVQENLRTGKRSFYGIDKDGHSRTEVAAGCLAMTSQSGRASDNVGVDLSATNGAVEIFGGAASTAGAADGDPNPNAPSNQKNALSLRSARSTLVEAVEAIRSKAKEIKNTASVIAMESSSAVNINSGDTVSTSTKTLGVSVAGRGEYSYGGPTDGLPTNGASRTTTFSANPATGSVGGAVDEYSILFGGRKETLNFGKRGSLIRAGSFAVSTMTPVPMGFITPGQGVNLSTGILGLNNSFTANLATASVVSNLGTAKLAATKGPATVSGTVTATLQSLGRARIQAPFVQIRSPLSTPGGVLTDGCLDSLTGRPFLTSGTIGCVTFRVG